MKQEIVKRTAPIGERTNADWPGRPLRPGEELDLFAQESSMRVWINEQGNSFPPHWHNALEILIPLENWYDVELPSRSYHLLPGEILIIPSLEAREFRAPKSGNRVVFLFNTDFLSQIKGFPSLRSLPENLRHITPDTFQPIYGEIYGHFVQMWNEYFSNTEFYEFAVYSHLFQVFTLLSRFQGGREMLFADSSPSKRREYLSKFKSVLNYIDEHCVEDLNLDGVAAYSSFSRYHFARLFKEYTGETFYDYLTRRRIELAEALLSRQELTVTEVALQSGFSSISTFNRTFKSRKGCTPSKYRALYSIADPRSGMS